MRNIIIFSQDNQLSEYYQSVIKGLYDIEAKDFHEINNFTTYLKNQDAAIVNYEGEDSEKIIKFCLESTPKIPCIVTGNEEELSEAKLKFKTHGLLDYFPHSESVEVLWQKINRFTNLHQRSLQKKEFCKVNLSFFLSTKTVFCDIYLRVSENKYLKIFNRYDEIDFKDIKKYDHKNIQYLYVRERDFAMIMKKLVEELQPLMEQPQNALMVSNHRLNSTISIQLQETVSESVQKLGLNNEAIEMTNLAINSTMDIVQRNEEIYQILQDVIQGKNYISEHSFLLTYISCSLLKESPYAHPANNLALSVAAFFHDIALDKEEKARVQTKNEFQFKVLGIKDKEDVIHHPLKAAELVCEIDGIPDTVENILVQHHENYDGSGFPLGIDYKRIHPLSAIFNVSHELAMYFFDSGQNPENVRDIIIDLSQKYTRGNYKMAIDAAVKVFNVFDAQVVEDLIEDYSPKKKIV